MISNSTDAERALDAVGQILHAEGVKFAIIVIGGAALQLLGVVDRATRDVDVVALAEPPDANRPRLRDPGEELPDPLRRAREIVAEDLGLDSNWLNLGPALQWKQGLPPGFEDRLQWRRYHSLTVGIADRRDLIAFKLYAAADSTGPSSVHYQDLIALGPSTEEIDWAAEWVRTQDVAPEFHAVLTQVADHVKHSLA
jgi:hypothetical protein